MDSRFPIARILTIGLLPGFIKRFYYRLKGFKIGKDVRFSPGSIILAKSCKIKGNCRIGFLSVIRAESVEIGYGCQIRSLTLIHAHKVILCNDVIISETAIIRAGHISENSIISIEDRVHIFPNTIIDPSLPVELGEECAVGFNSNIYTHGSYKNILQGYKVSYGEVKIGKRVELTYNVFIAPGVSVGDDAIIAYGSYVNKNIPAGSLAGGVPAKVIRVKEEFVNKPSYKEQLEIICDIINKFCDHLIFMGRYRSVNKTQNFWEMNGTSGSMNIILYSEVVFEKIPGKNDLIVIFSDKSVYSENLEAFQYFDLTNYKCSSLFKQDGQALKKYFSRYGIRFSPQY